MPLLQVPHGAVNVHGHVHEQESPTCNRHVNVSVEQTELPASEAERHPPQYLCAALLRHGKAVSSDGAVGMIVPTAAAVALRVSATDNRSTDCHRGSPSITRAGIAARYANDVFVYRVIRQ